MNLDELTDVWRSQDLSPLYGVDKAQLHQVLRQEQKRHEKQERGLRWFMSIVSAFLVITAVLFLAIMIDPYDDDVLNVWDYAIGAIGVVSAVVLAGALLALRRSRQAREQEFGDSLRDHLRRRIVQLDDEATRDRRLGLITLASSLICGWAISVAGRRINDVPYSDIRWVSFPSVLIVLLVCFWLFRRAARLRQRGRARKEQLETLLNQLDGR